MSNTINPGATGSVRAIMQGVAVLAIFGAAVALINLYVDVRLIAQRIDLIEQSVAAINRALNSDTPPAAGRSIGGF